MNKPPSVEWSCSECRIGESQTVNATGSTRTFLNHIIWRHRELSPACSALNVALQVPYESLPSATEIKSWQKQQDAKRKALLDKGLAARRRALAAKKAKKKAE